MYSCQHGSDIDFAPQCCDQRSDQYCDQYCDQCCDRRWGDRR